jgi:hypothetical protein
MKKVDKRICIPKDKSGGSPKYPWKTMEVGDSFFAEDVGTSTLSAAANGYTKRNPGVKFTCREWEGGTRVWRIA